VPGKCINTEIQNISDCLQPSFDHYRPMMCECVYFLFHFAVALPPVRSCCEGLLDNKSTETDCNKNDTSHSLCPLFWCHWIQTRAHHHNWGIFWSIDLSIDLSINLSTYHNFCFWDWGTIKVGFML